MPTGTLAQSLLDLLFPPRCVACGASGALLCARCLASIRVPEPPICRRCGRSLPNHSQINAAAVCALCASGRELPSLDGLRAASIYEGAVRQAILTLKFRGQRRLAQPLADLLALCYRREALSADLIVPVPLHASRRRQRGFDQATLLAQALHARLGIPVRTDLLARTRATRAQMTLSRSERLTNVSGAFALTSSSAPMSLAGKRVLLVDDVTTTGSTMDAAASALREVHPAAIWGVAVARPVLEDEGDHELARARTSTTSQARRRGGR